MKVDALPVLLECRPRARFNGEGGVASGDEALISLKLQEWRTRESRFPVWDRHGEKCGVEPDS